MPGAVILPLSAHPQHVPLVARWLVAAFQDEDGLSEAQMTALILAPPQGPEEAFLLLDGGEPAGTASLARQDLDSRPDLSPWLAGVFVRPEFRGRGHATALVRRVEGFAGAAGVGRLWLYTNTATGLYARLGWREAGAARTLRTGKPVTLMTRELRVGMVAPEG